MKSFILFIISLLLTVSAWASNTDVCSQDTTVSSNNIVKTLIRFNNTCTKKLVAKQLSKEIPKSNMTKADILAKAWEGIKNNINNDMGQDWGDLPESDPLKDVYQEVKDRCSKAMEDVKKDPKTEDTIMAQFNTWDLTDDLILLPIEGTNFEYIQLKPIFEEVCRSEENGNGSCPKTFARSKVLITYLASTERLGRIYSQNRINELNELLSKAVAPKWNKFFYDSKPMYPWDIFFTDFLYDHFSKEERSTYRNGFRLPPEWQFFILHPSAAIEYVDKAEDGEQLKSAIFAELFGVNKWEKGFLGLTGLSVIASYSDRKNVSDVGWGGLITFDNVYSFGVTTRSGDIGIFVSLDLANLFREKIKPSWDKYKNLKL